MGNFRLENSSIEKEDIQHDNKTFDAVQHNLD